MEAGIDSNSHSSSPAGITDNLIQFIKRPSTICRLIAMLFAVVVFGCISSGGYDPLYRHCIFNENQDACHYGVAIGVLAFLACIFFLAVDYQYNKITNGKLRKQLVSADLIFSAFWAFLWFVGFCFLADQWRKSSIKSQNQSNHARASIAFSFFSIFTWTTLGLMALQRYKQGADFQEYDNIANTNDYKGGYNGTSDFSNSPYASFPQPSGENPIPSYQQPPQYNVPDVPFGVPPPKPVATDYSIPDY